MTEQPSLTILIVEDDPTVRRLLDVALRRRGDVVLVAADTASALAIAAERSIDVLVTDVSMPDGSGIDLARRLRGRQPTLGVVVATGWGGRQLPELPDAAQVLEKPFGLAELDLAVDRARMAAARH